MIKTITTKNDARSESALNFISQGFNVIPLRGNSKKPRYASWTSHSTLSVDEFQQVYQTGDNIGIRTGSATTLEKGLSLIVLDVDIKTSNSDEIESLNNALRELLGDFTDKPTVISGSGGKHYYFTIDAAELPNKAKSVLAHSQNKVTGTGKHEWAIELIGTGAQIVAPPSLHPDTNQAYEWVGEVAETPASLLSVIKNLEVETKHVTATQTISMAIAETESNVTKLKEALLFISPCSEYVNWRDVVFSIAAHDFSCGYDLARGWSSSCAEKFDDAAFNTLWNSFKSNGGIGSGTLYHHAKQNGWQSVTQQVTAGAANDVLAGELFANAYHGHLLYVHDVKKWLHWTGTRWAWCVQDEVLQCAKKVAIEQSLEAEHALATDPKNHALQKRVTAAKAAQCTNKLRAAAEVASSEPNMGIASIALLDANPYLLGVQNGVVDLRSGLLINPIPDLLITKSCEANFVPDAQCPLFLKAISEIFQNDAEMIAYIQRQLGYALTGDVSEEALFFWIGKGANGKSMLVNIIANILGDYAAIVGCDLLSARREAKSNSDRSVAHMVGARMVLVNELSEGEVWNDGRLRELVSTEKISARHLYSEQFSFKPTHKIFVRANSKPIIRDGSDGTWRRLHLVHFERQFSESERDYGLDEKILACERDGILNWLVQGCLEWSRVRLSKPIKVSTATRTYRDDSDVVLQFLNEKCTVEPTLKYSKTELHSQYSRWAKANGFHPASSNTFTKRLADKNITVAADKRSYEGVDFTGTYLW